MEETKQEVAAPETGAVPATQGRQGRGYGKDLDQDDYQIPRAKIVTFTSREAMAEKEENRIPAGRFINDVSRIELSQEFIPVYCYKNYVRWNPMKKEDRGFNPDFEPGKRIFVTDDRTDPRVIEGIKFGPNSEKPLVTKVLNYLCYFPGQRFPLLLSFKSTSYKGAKKLNYMLEEAGGDIYSNKYQLIIGMETKANNSYYVMDVKAAGKSSAEEYAACQAIYDRFYAKDIESMATVDDQAEPVAQHGGDQAAGAADWEE